jgi:hypothetical protein
MAKSSQSGDYPKNLAGSRIDLAEYRGPGVEEFVRSSVTLAEVDPSLEVRVMRALEETLSALTRVAGAGEGQDPGSREAESQVAIGEAALDECYIDLLSSLPAAGELMVEVRSSVDFRRLLPRGPAPLGGRQGLNILAAVDALTLGRAGDGRHVLRLSFCF